VGGRLLVGTGRPGALAFFPLNPALLRSGARMSNERSAMVSGGQQIKRSGRSPEREQSGERESRKWSWAISGKFCSSAPLTWLTIISW